MNKSMNQPLKPPKPHKFNVQIADIAAKIKPFYVMKILAQAKALQAAGREIIHMEIGEPDFASLPCVHDAALQAANLGLTHYTPTTGLPALRHKLADFYQRFYHAKVAANNIMLTPGSSSALHLVLTAILNPGDKVLLTDPAYPCNRQFVTLLHGTVIAVPVGQSTQYQLNTALLKAHWQPGIKAVMVATPANPTGTLIEQDELLKMAQFLAEKQCYLIVDEIYQGLVFDRPAESILAHKNLPENVIVINSFSKFFGMTGWRLGWCLAPDSLMPVLERLGQNLFLAAPTLSQYGALRVLEDDELAQLELRRQTFESRRNTLYHGMLAAGFTLKILPQGAFYLYWDVSDFTQDSEHFCSALLQATGVAITPGRDFGDHQYEHHVRLAYTTSESELTRAVEKIAAFVNTYQDP